MKQAELKDQFLALSEAEQAIVLERLVGALTCDARRGYNREDRTVSDGDKLIVINELIHSLAGFLVQFHLAPETARADLLWDTLFHKAAASPMGTALPKILQEILDSREEAARLAKLARPVADEKKHDFSTAHIATETGVAESAAPYGKRGKRNSDSAR